MRARLAAHPPWRQLVIICVVLPIVCGAAVLAFAWPAAHIAPRDLPIGVVGTDAASQQVISAVERAQPGAFEPRRYLSEAAARTAVEDRDVYGALVVSAGAVDVLTADAAGPSVSQIVTSVGERLEQQLTAGPSAGPAQPVRVEDVVPLSPADPRGSVLSSALLPLSICSIILAAVIALLLNFRPAGRQLLALVSVSGAAGLGAFLVAQTWLDALPHRPVETWAALALTILAMSATAAGLIAMIGSAGLGVGAALMVFVGNPFSGSTSAPQLLPTAIDHLGQLLPPGAGVGLVRSTAYFGGHGSAAYLVVLLGWSGLGLLAVVLGHHTFIGYAARVRRAEARQSTPSSGASTVDAH